MPEAAIRDRDLRRTILGSAKRAPGRRWRRRSIARGGRARLDPNDWRVVSEDAVGLRYTPLTTSGHQRVGIRERLLDVAKQHPDRLMIKTHALVTRVLFDGDSARSASSIATASGCTAPTRVQRAGRADGGRCWRRAR